MDSSRVTWRKSSFSGNGGADCVEVAVVPGDPTLAGHKADADEHYLVRDSKDPNGPKLTFTRSEWAAFVKGVKADEFDV
ncbi:DUF397 domain-containing protein [Streptosporangium sp. CA-135522]|uniref:DUF397 domain-containing protein n=1 Tax=Streptosporangium sp. CA-135522 TaxID=3240072 RepID=UPI003D8BEBA2